MYYLKLYLFAFVGFLAIDMVWLTVVARGFYRKQLGFLLSDQPNWWAAICLLPAFRGRAARVRDCPRSWRPALCARPCFWAPSLAWSPTRPTT